MKTYTLTKNGENVKDDDGDLVMGTCDKGEVFVTWINQMCYSLNGYGETKQFKVEITDCTK